MISKSDLRKKIIAERKLPDIAMFSDLICKNILDTEIYKNSVNIFAYFPMRYEIDIQQLFEDKTKNWFLPKVNGEDLDFYKYTIGDKLTKSNFGVYEPTNTEKTSIIPDLIIVPALCMDKKHYRLGYGKGFYDRFLGTENCKNVPTLTPIYSKFIIDELDINTFDKKIDYIITELR